MPYEPKHIESKWQAYWEKHQTFRTAPLSETKGKPKKYILDMFPYPSSNGLHVGHPEGYTATDILARYYRAKGFQVLHPMGWDAFGLPAEQYAIQTGVHPAETTKKSIKIFKRQLKALGFSFDWSREISTADPKYYKWTQWIFLKLYERGLVCRTEEPVNWCPFLRTVLANEEVKQGVSERGGHPVYRVPMVQWKLKITSYAESLLEGLEHLDWPEGTKELQRNWIGKSEGLDLTFEGEDGERVEVFTSRPDTLFGVRFVAISTAHPLAEGLAKDNRKVAAVIEKSRRMSEVERSRAADKEKTGVFTDRFLIHPLTKEKIPLFVADYVLGHYGTGALMGVPAHDERDAEFAQVFQLPWKSVIEGGVEDACFTGKGILKNSGKWTGQHSQTAIPSIIREAEAEGWGKGQIRYKLRDWLFSRQRYWGEPIPMKWQQDKMKAEVCLPLVLPDVQSYEPDETGRGPLHRAKAWHYLADNEGPFERETDTMPGSAGSSWYFFRYCDPTNDAVFASLESLQYWLPVDIYVGGQEHATGHLLYARFWTHVLYDLGLSPVKEPFQKLVHQGMILGPDGEKMSKSRGNVINPDEVMDQFGADTLRVYEMFLGPLEQAKPWNTEAMQGIYRFLSRFFRLFETEAGDSALKDRKATREDLQVLHLMIQKVTLDIEKLAFNTAISQMMIAVNHFTKEGLPFEIAAPLIQCLHPFAPHLAEECWEKLQVKEALSFAPWPSADESLIETGVVSIALQINGKTRSVIEVAVHLEQAELEVMAKAALKAHLGEKKVLKTIFVPGRILNFVVPL
jgi:leucyl-tRNA synthetase